jgi:CubicO group peptidase (beta-lactamase class C family)
MNAFGNTAKRLLVLAAIVLGLYLVFYVFVLIYLSVRYSPEYMNREIFHDLGNAYDYRFFPERKLNASSEPFQFAVDPTKQAMVLETFQSGLELGDLNELLADSGTQALLIIQNDKLIYEQYRSGYQRNSIVTSFSVAKSVTSALIGIAIDEGYIKSAEDPITDYIPELLERDPRYQEIQIKDLLLMASGLHQKVGGLPGTSDDNLTYAFNDLRHLVLTETSVADTPGTKFVYNTFNPLILGMILERTTGRPVTTDLQEKIWSPLGMQFDGSWSLDSEETGFEKMESGLNASAIDFAKFGRLYLNSGKWDGIQVIPANWVAVSTRDSGLFSEGPVHYGYMWCIWECTPDSTDYFAQGNFGQYIYVSPARNMIFVRNGEQYGLDDELTWPQIFCEFTQAMP